MFNQKLFNYFSSEHNLQLLESEMQEIIDIVNSEDKVLYERQTFGQALAYLKDGFRAARAGWNGKGIFIKLQVPDALSKMTHPYIYIDTTGLETDNPNALQNRVPWIASQTDLLSDDWLILN